MEIEKLKRILELAEMIDLPDNSPVFLASLRKRIEKTTKELLVAFECRLTDQYELGLKAGEQACRDRISKKMSQGDN
jgi:hypothetical protein